MIKEEDCEYDVEYDAGQKICDLLSGLAVNSAIEVMSVTFCSFAEGYDMPENVFNSVLDRIRDIYSDGKRGRSMDKRVH